MRTLSRFLLLVTLLGLSACRTPHHLSQEGKPGEAPPMWGWDDKAAAKAKGPVQVKVVLKEQKAYITKGTTEIGWTYTATGIAKFPTPVGSYQIMERTSDKHSNLYGRICNAKGECINEDAKMGRDPVPEGCTFKGATMAYWMRLTNDGLGMHVGAIPHPGSRASHGCARLPHDAAKKIFQTVRVGTPVIIVQEANDPLPPRRTMEVLPAVTKPKIAAPKPSGSKPKLRTPSDFTLPGLPPLQDKPPSLSVPAPKPAGN
jgi:hypothetical protein